MIITIGIISFLESKAKLLKDIIRKHDPEVMVAFDSSNEWQLEAGEMMYTSSNIGTLTLYKIYEEVFVRTNTIANGNFHRG